MANVHPKLQELLERRNATREAIRAAVSEGSLTEDQGKAEQTRIDLAYEADRKEILADLGLCEDAPVAPIPMVLTPTVVSAAEQRRAEEERIRALQKSVRITNLVPSAAPKPISISLSKTEIVDGEKVTRLLSPEELKAAQVTAQKTAQRPANPSPSASTVYVVPAGMQVIGGVLRPIPRETQKDPRTEEIRRRWKAGEITLESAKAEWAALKAEKPLSAQIICEICKGNAPNDKITGKLCRCGGKGAFAVDTASADQRLARGAYAVDPTPVSEDEVSYTAYLTDGRTTTVYSDHGQKAIRSACESLRASGTGFQRIKLDSGCMLVLHDYDTLCPACHGSCRVEGKTCVQCTDGRVSGVGRRFFFPDTEKLSGAAAADQAGLDSMSGFDPDRQCGRKKCKGASCRACEDARQGGFQKPGYARCGECKGTGKLDGAEHQKCRGKGFFTVTEFYWTSPNEQRYAVTAEIRRVDLLAEDRLPKRDRPIAIQLGADTVLVGSGKVPSRKGGAIMHRTGTAKNRFDTAKALRSRQGVYTGPVVKESKATFSAG